MELRIGAWLAWWCACMAVWLVLTTSLDPQELIAGVFAERLPAPLDPRRSTLMDPLAARLRGLHDGHVGDYLAYLTAGTAVLGAAAAFLLR